MDRTDKQALAIFVVLVLVIVLLFLVPQSWWAILDR